MIRVFMLPDLGEGLTESEIISWKVSEGDQVTLNQVIAEVETAKAVVELPSPYAGVIAKLHEPPGTVIEVGKPIVSFEVCDDVAGAPEQDELKEPEGTQETAQKRVPTLVGYGAEPDRQERPLRRRRAGKVGAGRDSLGSDPVTVRSATVLPAYSMERPRSTPPVRKLARDRRIDLATVSGTGPQGLITREDVQRAHHASGSQAGASPRSQASGAEQGGAEQMPREIRVPIRGVRKHTAEAMVASAFTAPHVTEFLTVDVTATMELIGRLRQHREFTEVKLTPLTILA